MKIFFAVLISVAITLTLPAFFKDCSGKALWVINRNSLNLGAPAALTSAYNTLIDINQKPCTSSVVSRTVQKWRSSDGVWHVSDSTENAAQPNSTAIVIESSLIPSRDEPAIRTWVPMAILGFCAGLSATLFLVMWGLGLGWQFFHRESSAIAEAVEYQERRKAGELVVFADSTPHEILGVDAKASLEEVEIAYERLLSTYQEELGQESHAAMTPEIKNKFLTLHQAYEALTRRKVDKYLAVTD